jgi:hypothetical protein
LHTFAILCLTRRGEYYVDCGSPVGPCLLLARWTPSWMHLRHIRKNRPLRAVMTRQGWPLPSLPVPLQRATARTRSLNSLAPCCDVVIGCNCPRPRACRATTTRPTGGASQRGLRQPSRPAGRLDSLHRARPEGDVQSPRRLRLLGVQASRPSRAWVRPEGVAPGVDQRRATNCSPASRECLPLEGEVRDETAEAPWCVGQCLLASCVALSVGVAC